MQLEQSIILFARSTDGGKTFISPIRISTHAGLPRDDNRGLVGFVGVVGADGTIYAVWNDGSTIAFTQSHDGGKTFTPSRSVIDVAPPYFGGAGGIPGVARAMGFPQIGVGKAEGKHTVPPLYVAWSDFHNGDVDVFLRPRQTAAVPGPSRFASTMTLFTTASTSFFSGWSSTPLQAMCTFSSMIAAKIPQIARPASRWHAQPTEEKHLSTTLGRKLHLHPKGQYSWVITLG
jgi:hypothetical protein